MSMRDVVNDPVRRRLHVLLLTWRLRRTEMNVIRLASAALFVLMLPAPASAELRLVRIDVLGMT